MRNYLAISLLLLSGCLDVAEAQVGHYGRGITAARDEGGAAIEGIDEINCVGDGVACARDGTIGNRLNMTIGGGGAGGFDTAGSGLTSVDTTVNVGAGTGISVAADSVAVNQAFTPTWSAQHIFDIPLQQTVASLPTATGSNLKLGNAYWASAPRLWATNADSQRPIIPHFGRRVIGWRPVGSNTTGTSGEVIGITGSGGGTVSHPAVALTNYGTAQTKTRRVAANVNQNTFCNFGVSAGDFTISRGNSAGLGGFVAVFRFGQNIATDLDAAFVGLTNTTPTNGAPASTADIIGICYEAADAIGSVPNWQTCRNDNSGSGTKVDLGNNCPRDTSTIIEVVIYAAPNSSSVGMRVTNLTTGALCLETGASPYTTDLPRNSIFMGPFSGQQNGTGGVACGHDLVLWDIVAGN